MRLSRMPFVSLAALAILVAALAGLGLLRSPNEPTCPSAYSRSAIGHKAMLELLRLHGVHATISQGASRAKLRAGGLLILAEPNPLIDPNELRLLLTAPRVLLVLPKWAGIADSDMPGWIEAATRLPMSAPISVLQDAFPRNFGTRGITNAQGKLIWPHNALGLTPRFDAAAQLLTGNTLDAVVGGSAGLLVGEKRGATNTIYVLTDPDIISNHGLAAGNAAFALALFDRARAGGPVVFDETIHGFRTVPKNTFLAIFSRPFAAVTFAAMAAAGLLAWADGKRFGTPLPRPGGAPAGQLALIGAMAGLLDRGGHQKTVLARYVRGVVTDVSATLQRTRTDAPARLAEAETRRGVGIRAADILQQAAAIENTPRPAAASMAALALRAHAWKQEMVHGPAGYPRDI